MMSQLDNQMSAGSSISTLPGLTGSGASRGPLLSVLRGESGVPASPIAPASAVWISASVTTCHMHSGVVHM